MAVGATVFQFTIDLADTDRAVYESLSLRVARHPSESGEYLWARVLAYALEYADGIEFSPGGLSDPDEPALSVKDLTGARLAWIEIGTPDAERIHRAAKASPRVAVYVHKDPVQYLARLGGARIHPGADVALWSFERPLLSSLALRLERRIEFALSVTDRELYLAFADDALTGRVVRHTMPA